MPGQNSFQLWQSTQYLEVAVEGSVVEAGPAGPVGYIHVGQQWNKELGALDGIVSSGDVQRRLPVLVTSVHVRLMS